MTDSLTSRLTELVAQWRERAYTKSEENAHLIAREIHHCADELEAESPAAPLVSPPGEPGTCATCRWFRPTEESFGICQKEPSEWPMHWRETWPQFGCIGHTPIEVQEALPTHLGELRDGWEASLVVARIVNGSPISELAWVCQLCGHQQGTPHHETCARAEAPPSAPPPTSRSIQRRQAAQQGEPAPTFEAAPPPAETRQHHIWCNIQRGPVELCRMCSGPEGLHATYPQGDKSGVELMAQHFPNNVPRLAPAAEARAETRGEELTSGSALVSADRTTVTWINQHGHTVTVQVHEPAPRSEP